MIGVGQDLALGVGASEDGVVALVGVEDSVSLARVEDAVGDAAGCVEAFADGWPVLFAPGWHVDGLELRHEGCGGLGKGAVSGEHEEIEGACGAGSFSVIEEAGSVDGEDGSGLAPSGSVAGVLAESESARWVRGAGSGRRGVAAGSIVVSWGFPCRPFGEGGSRCGVWGWGVFPVSPSPPGAARASNAADFRRRLLRTRSANRHSRRPNNTRRARRRGRR